MSFLKSKKTIPKTKAVLIPYHSPYSAAAASGLSYFKVALLHLQNSYDTKANSDTLLYFNLFRTHQQLENNKTAIKSQAKAKLAAGTRERRRVDRVGVMRISVISMERKK